MTCSYSGLIQRKIINPKSDWLGQEPSPFGWHWLQIQVFVFEFICCSEYEESLLAQERLVYWLSKSIVKLPKVSDSAKRLDLKTGKRQSRLKPKLNKWKVMM